MPASDGDLSKTRRRREKFFEAESNVKDPLRPRSSVVYRARVRLENLLADDGHEFVTVGNVLVDGLDADAQFLGDCSKGKVR